MRRTAPLLLALLLPLGTTTPAEAVGQTHAVFAGRVDAGGRSGDTQDAAQDFGSRCDQVWIDPAARALGSCYVEWAVSASGYTVCTTHYAAGAVGHGFYYSAGLPTTVNFTLYGVGAPGEATLVGYFPVGLSVYTIHIDASDFCAATGLAAPLLDVKASASNFHGTVERMAV